MAWADYAGMLLDIAAERVEKEWLVYWWRKKYNRPSKDPLLLEYTREELYVEYLEDQIAEQGGVEHVVLNTGTKGEPVLVRPRGTSELEQRIARGEPVDVLQGVVAEDRARIERFVNRKKKTPVEPSSEEFSDDYTKDGG